MSEAATRLTASRSGVSQQIANLESFVGAPLFDRSARPLTLTPAGLMLRRHAHRILEAVSEARTEMMELSLSSLEALHLGIIDDLDASITPALVTHLRELYSALPLRGQFGSLRRLDASPAQARDRYYRHRSGAGGPFSVRRLSGSSRAVYLGGGAGRLQAARGLAPANGGATLCRLSSRPCPSAAPSPSTCGASGSICNRPTRSMLRVRCLPWSDSPGGGPSPPRCAYLTACGRRAELECLRLPFAGLTRTIRLVARREELGHLPRRLAVLCRRLIDERLASQVERLAPWLVDEFIILGDDGNALKREAASVRAAGES